MERVTDEGPRGDREGTFLSSWFVADSRGSSSAPRVGQRLSNNDIAYTLLIRDRTVRHHMRSMFDKVSVPNRQKLLIHGTLEDSPTEGTCRYVSLDPRKTIY